MGTYFSDCQSPVASGVGFMDCEHRTKEKVEASYKAGSCDKHLCLNIRPQSDILLPHPVRESVHNFRASVLFREDSVFAENF